MSVRLVFNPLTIATPFTDESGPGLELRSFAKGRSLLVTRIKRSVEPKLFGALVVWIKHGKPGGPPALARERQLELWTDGLLVSKAERDEMPADARPSASPVAVAAMFCPEVAELVQALPTFLSPPSDSVAKFEAAGICELPLIFAPAEQAAIRAYYRKLRDGNWLKPDRHQTRQKIAKNDPLARHIQAALIPLVSGIAGRRVKECFSYATEYLEQAPLPRHKDRAQGEFTISMYVDFLPEPETDRSPWPLIIHRPDGDTEYVQVRGGGLLFKGCELEHSRAALNPGESALLVMLCYVPEEFEGVLD